jgi:hypothetical protein
MQRPGGYPLASALIDNRKEGVETMGLKNIREKYQKPQPEVAPVSLPEVKPEREVRIDPGKGEEIGIRIATSPYAPRQYGRPWIAVVDFSAGPKGEFRWGGWSGDMKTGGPGILSINAIPGSIIAQGQRHRRDRKLSVRGFSQLREDGSLNPLRNKLQALSLWQEEQEEKEHPRELKEAPTEERFRPSTLEVLASVERITAQMEERIEAEQESWDEAVKALRERHGGKLLKHGQEVRDKGSMIVGAMRRIAEIAEAERDRLASLKF